MYLLLNINLLSMMEVKILCIYYMPLSSFILAAMKLCTFSFIFIPSINLSYIDTENIL